MSKNLEHMNCQDEFNENENPFQPVPKQFFYASRPRKCQ